MIDARERDILQTLYADGPSSRWELHERTGHTPNRVGLIVDSLVRKGLLRDGAPQPRGVGRPRVPVEIDPSGAELIGLAITPGGFDTCRMNLVGDVLEQGEDPHRVAPDQLIQTAAKSLGRMIGDRTFGVGVSVTGFIDPAAPESALEQCLAGPEAGQSEGAGSGGGPGGGAGQ